MSELLALGISHKTAPVALRERLALGAHEAEQMLHELVAHDGLHEAVAISTCNRTEVYVVATDPVEAEAALLGNVAKRAGIRPTELAGVVYSPRNCDAARQLYRVTSGLESMIVGEAEVQGQFKRAYELALAAGTTGPLTNRLFRAALEAGKRVRTQTDIGREHVSVSTVAVQLAREAVGDLADRSVVVVGAGETSERTARALAEQGVTTIFIANRHADRARALADRFGGTVSSLHDLPTRLEDADIVVASTSSPHALIGSDELELVMQARDRRPLVLIDIAVPRDIEPACSDVAGVTLYDMDDLQAAVARNMEVRASSRAQAEEVVEEEIQRFARWMGQLDVRPTIAALRETGDAIVEQVLSENEGRWEALSPRDRARVEALARAVMQRALHEPTLRLKALADDTASGHGRLQIARELFGLDPGSQAAGEGAGDATVTPLDERRRPAG
ncbi:MAG: glutamyl-tRNA reductase [bacterium]